MIIRPGDRGDEVRDVQRRLAALGSEIAVDELGVGAFGPSTETAVRAFQHARGLPADGLVGPDTWSQLVEAGYALGDRTLYLRQPFFRGDDVRTLQRMLNALGFEAGREDGILGVATDRGVREFQRNVGREPDGIVGHETLAALERLRPPTEGPSRAVVREEEDIRVMETSLRGSVVAVDPAAPAEADTSVADAVATVARDLAEELAARGARPVLLDAAESPGARARRANDLGAALCVSLRPDPAAEAFTCFSFGTETTRSPAGQRLSELIAEHVHARFRGPHAHGEVAPQTRTARRSVTILRETRMPAVQVEPPASWPLGDARFRRALAEAIADGVDGFLGVAEAT